MAASETNSNAKSYIPSTIDTQMNLCPTVSATPITVMGSVMGLFLLRNGVYLVTAISKPHCPMRKNSGNCNGVCRYVGAITFFVFGAIGLPGNY